MIVAYVVVETQDHAASEFERILSEIQAEVRQMTGCITNEWYRHPDSPNKYISYGEFDTHEHFESYLNSELVKRIGAEIIPLLANPPRFKHYEATILEEN